LFLYHIHVPFSHRCCCHSRVLVCLSHILAPSRQFSYRISYCQLEKEHLGRHAAS
jgi:hypothetical protein